MEKKNATHWDLSKTQAELLDRIASANDVLDEKIGGQKKEINELSGRVKTQNAGFKDLSGKVETQDTEMKTLIEKVDALEKENQMLREKTDALHSENTKFRDSFNKLEQASERVLAASRESDERNAAADAGGRIPRGHKRRRSREGSDEDQDQETRIPNSMPTPTSRRSNRGSTQRTATDTTLGSLSDLDGSYSSRTPSNRQSRRVSAEAKEDLVKLQQEGRTLQAYLSLAIDLRSRRAGTSDKPWVSAFITGLNDRQIAQRLERDVPEVLYSSPNLAWDAMRIAVENIIAAEGVRKQESVDEIARDNTSGKSGTKKKDAKRKRRSLAIVPLDDEDVVFVAR
ncbi:hypothetical protein BJY04DRAFT_186068 [Aspergillus karnatakaensis]|uniref:uncharacterized protein n=1 Tax=Aspergillus karnatakaensis TaxID=1810916 RepID=UPI003CCCC401